MPKILAKLKLGNGSVKCRWSTLNAAEVADKSIAVAEMGDRLATIVSRGAGSPRNTMAWAEA